MVNVYAIQKIKRSKTPPNDKLSDDSSIGHYKDLNIMERSS